MNLKIISQDELDKSLTLRDLSDEKQGTHAMQILVQSMHEALAQRWRCERILYRSCPVVGVAENYDDLGYPKEGISRDSRYTRYVSTNALLRTQTSASIPILLRSLVLSPPTNLLLICPGLAYRRDVIDCIHVGEPHQIDLWYLKNGRLDSNDLQIMISDVVAAVLPGRRHRTVSAHHPYTIHGLQIDIESEGEWIEIGECGVADPALIARCGLRSSETSGLAMGLGLDRILMLRKNISDIRLLRSNDSRVANQMLDLAPYKSVSNQPYANRDLSLSVDADLHPEELGDMVRSVLGEDIDCLESLEILSETAYEKLPESARSRIGMTSNQKNILVRLVIRHPTTTLTSVEANEIRDRVYRALHMGQKMELANG